MIQQMYVPPLCAHSLGYYENERNGSRKISGYCKTLLRAQYKFTVRMR